MLYLPGPVFTNSRRPPIIDKIWKKSYLANSTLARFLFWLCSFSWYSWSCKRKLASLRKGYVTETDRPEVVDQDIEEAENDN
jgi:hypothetical protein